MRKNKGLAATLTAQLVWGLQALCYYFIRTDDQSVILAFRIVVASTLLFSVAVLLRKFREFLKMYSEWKMLKYLIPSAALLLFDWAIFIWAAKNGKILDASLGHYISPIMIFLFGVLFFKETCTKAHLYLYGRYQGDMMNFSEAAEECANDGIRVECVTVSDDIASAPPEKHHERRGVAGIFLAYKVAGAMAAEMADLDEVKRVAMKAVDNMRSLGVALGPCTVPAVGKPNFEISDDEMEVGMGIHGEQGVERVPMRSADEIAEILVDKIVADMPYNAGDEVAVLMNSLGATPLEELYVLYRKVDELLKDKNIKVYKPYVGRYACSMEMQGASLTLMKLDSELKRLLDAPADSPFFRQF